jgi:hypothetical protein
VTYTDKDLERARAWDDCAHDITHEDVARLIAAVQREALMDALSICAVYNCSAAGREGRIVAGEIYDDILALMEPKAKDGAK